MLATISGQSLVNNLVSLIVVGIIIWLLYWVIGKVGLPEPFNKVATVILAVASAVFLIYFLLNFMSGKPIIAW